MKSKWFRIVIITLCCLLPGGCSLNSRLIESISIDFPHGETRLVVWKNGEAALFYGARPQHEVVKTGVFNVQDIYKQLRQRLNPNVPREDWPDPKATAGMVQIRLKNKRESAYLIFDEKEFMEELFIRARQNIVGSRL